MPRAHTIARYLGAVFVASLGYFRACWALLKTPETLAAVGVGP